MSTETTALTPRQRLVDLLCDDLNTQGWDQNNKLWFVKGDAGDEWFEFVGEFSGAPENHLVDLIAKDDSREGVTGVVVSTEGWAYPKKLADTFKSEAALRSYWRLVPPSEHPEKVEIRHLLFASSDGEVIGLTARRDSEGTREWAALTADQTCPTGDRTVDAARALLGINDALKQRVMATLRKQPNTSGPMIGMVPGLSGLNEQLQSILGTLQEVLDGKITAPEATLQLFHSMPEEQRVQMLADMPEFIKDEFRNLLSDEERKKYGL